jgi:alpha-L-rhamnosidase
MKGPQSNQRSQPNPKPTVGDFRFEYRAPVLGIGVANPRLSWKTITMSENWMQASYEVSVEFSDRETSTSCMIVSPESVFNPWPFWPLLCRNHAKVRVRIWGKDGIETDWCGPFAIEGLFLSVSDWQARFVAASWDHAPEKSGPSPF